MIYKWVGRSAFSCLGRGLVEIVLLPFQAVLVSAVRDRASSDLGGKNLPVFEIPISWFMDLAFHSMPKPTTPTKGSMGLILSSDASGYFYSASPSSSGYSSSSSRIFSFFSISCILHLFFSF